MDEPIAVIGLDARFPGDSETPEKFYEFLLKGRSAQTAIPSDRYNAEALWHPDTNRSGTTRVRSGHFLKGSIAAFDAPFFSITPAEAKSMDPQQRGLLESVYKALENAGISLQQAAGSQTGVYVGCMYSDYDRMTVKDVDVPSKYAALGTVYSMLSNRVSWCFDLRGPSMTIDTACSSSLVALHNACNSLKLREASMAVVGGCNLILSPEFPLLLDTAGVLGPDGISYSFDHRGNGYSRGDGFGTVVLKRVSDAIRDGDVIRAVIRNTGCNQDGKSPGITSPTKAAQAELIRQTYARAALDPSVTRFFEAHGTGTAVGDPIETGAISEIFTTHRSEAEPLYVGALKSNIGHTEGAAGVAAIIKGVFTLERGVIPANTWFEKKNPRIQDSWHLEFPTQAVAWPAPGLRRMSINSFGVGGTNAHVVMDDAFHFLRKHHLRGLHRTLVTPVLPEAAHPVVEGSAYPEPMSPSEQIDSGVGSEYDASTDNEDIPATKRHRALEPKAEVQEQSVQNKTLVTTRAQPTQTQQEDISSHSSETTTRLFLLSSYDQHGVARQEDLYREYIATHGGKLDAVALRDLSYTLAHKRTHHGWRSFGVGKSSAELETGLGQRAPTRAAAEPRLAFIFTGQGAQWAAMGSELMVYPAFLESLYSADSYLNSLGSLWSLMYELTKDSKTSRLDAAEFSQPICTALQVAMVDLLKAWNIRPQAVAGHSSGEIAAAYAAGQLSRESAWRIAFYRGKLSARLASNGSQPKTGMAAVGADKQATLGYIERVNNLVPHGSLEIACENSPDSYTVSGDMAKIDALVALIKNDNAFARKLNVELAYHSRYMKPMAEEYLRLMGDVTTSTSTSSEREGVVFASSLHGRIIDPSDLQSPAYWVENLVSTVQFDGAVTAMLSSRTSSVKTGLSQNITDILEIGPHSALKGPLRSIAGNVPEGDKIRYHSLLKRRESAVDTVLEAAGSLWCSGIALDLLQVNRFNMFGSDRPVMLTNLPSYPFNHATEYWAESRLSRNSRFRTTPRHELLGAPVPDWNEHNAIWRNYIRVSENPWIEDHKVGGEALYPAAGMLVMAIEASRQLADKAKTVSGFRFKNVSFHLALRVPDDAMGIESHFYLRPYRNFEQDPTTKWNEFQLWTCENDVWREHCHGLVRTEYDDELPTQDAALSQSFEEAQRKIQTREGLTVSLDKVYRYFSRVGLDFGPTFRTLQSARVGMSGVDMLATVGSTVEQIRQQMPKNYLQPHLVHPSTLDGVIQANLAPLVLATKGTSRQTIVPVSAKELWIAADPSRSHDSYSVSTRCDARDDTDAETSFAAFSADGEVPMVHATGLKFRTLPGTSSEETQPVAHSLNLDWKPDPSFLDEEETAVVFATPFISEEDPSKWMEDCDTLCYLYMRRLLDSISKSDVEKMEWYHQKYVAWMQHILAKFVPQSEETDIALLEQRVRSHDVPEGRLIIAVGQALEAMLLGNTNPLDVVFNDKLAENVYRQGAGAKRCYAQMRDYIDALAHKNPNMRILEVGAGTGGTSWHVIEALTRNGRRYEHYDFTDISPSFFEHAKKEFKDHLDDMSFRVLNIEQAPAEQGFDTEGYDLVIAANVLHATKNMDNTLSNVKSLLRPGGKLLIFELTNTDVFHGGFCFGPILGWWLSEDADRQWGPLMTVESWRKHLSDTGFSSLVGLFNDFPGSHQTNSIMVSSVPVEETKFEPYPTTYLIADSQSELQQNVAGQLTTLLATENSRIETITLDDVLEKQWDQASGIMLQNLDSPLLRHMSSQRLKSLQHLVRHAKEIFTVSRGGAGLVAPPDTEMATGFARCLREESTDTGIFNVSFDESHSADALSKGFVKVLDSIHGGESDNTFRVVNETIHVPRLVQADYLTNHISARDKALCQFDSHASYVIAGGLGGLGQSIALWMASRGAKNLILLSRSGATEGNALELVGDLRRVCDNVATPACDITDLDRLRDVLQDCSSYMGPIKGCIQASMVLKDNLFVDMAFDEWQAGVQAKVQGSINLHDVLGSNLEFFILFSSTVALTGNPGQSNYAAANTYLDALARTWASQGERAVSVNLPVISDIGFVAEKPELLDNLRSRGWSHLEEDEVHAVLDYHCLVREEPVDVTRAQVVPRLWLPQDTAFEGAEMPPWASDQLFSHIRSQSSTASSTNKEETKAEVQLASLLATVSSSGEAEKVILDALLLKLSKVLSVELPNLDPSKAMHAYGVDSLVAVGLRAWFAKEVRADFSVFEMNDKPSIYHLASAAAERSKLLPETSK